MFPDTSSWNFLNSLLPLDDIKCGSQQNSFSENLSISSDVYPFSNLQASFIIFCVKWNAAVAALDCDLLTSSKETYDHSYNFSHDSSMDNINSTQWKYCSSTSCRLDRLPRVVRETIACFPGFPTKRRREKGAQFERFKLSFEGGVGTK